MAGFERFEDIEAWKESRVLAADVYRLTNQGPFRRDFGLKDQIRRAAVSVIPSLRASGLDYANRSRCDGTALGGHCGGGVAVANIAEGFGRRTNKDFAHFLYTAKASSLEVISHLYIALEPGYLDQEAFQPLYRGYDGVASKLIKLIRYLEKNPRPRT